jgi:hypothetical protein
VLDRINAQRGETAQNEAPAPIGEWLPDIKSNHGSLLHEFAFKIPDFARNGETCAASPPPPGQLSETKVVAISLVQFSMSCDEVGATADIQVDAAKAHIPASQCDKAFLPLETT